MFSTPPGSVQILIPLYYCAPELFLPIELCLSTLHASYPWIDLLLLDDASPLDIPSHWPVTDTNVINLGYTKTVNRLLELSTADVLIVANDDLQFYPGCLDRYFELPDMVIASPADSASGDLETFGCIFGMTRTTYEVLGPLDEQFTHFHSDADYYERALRSGVQVVKWRDIILQHPESSTFKALGNKEALLAADTARKRNIE